MKKLLIILTFVAMYASVNAQENKLQLGFKGGLNLSNLYDNDDNENDFRAGYHAGVFAKLPLTKSFSIQPEILYTLKGAKLKYDGPTHYNFNLDYVDLVLLAKFNITDYLSFHVGPYVGFLSNVRVKNDDSGSPTVNVGDDFNTDDFNRMDEGIAAGLGLDYGRFGIGLRYNYGLKTVGKEHDFGTVKQTVPNAKNSLFQAYVSISLL